MTQLHIRVATPDDFFAGDRYSAVHASLVASKWLAFEFKTETEDADKTGWRKMMEDPNHIVLIALERDGAGNEQWVGHVSLNLHNTRMKNHHVADWGIIVAEGKHNRGYGTALLEFMESYVKTQLTFVKKLSSSVLAGNENARHLYIKRGYQIEGVQQGQFRVDGELVDCTLLAKWIN